jgi:uncharacterized protein
VRALVALLGLVAVAYAALAAAVYALQERLLYLPTTPLEGSPADLGLRYEDVHFHAEDGVALHGWWIPADTARVSVLFMHGNAGNISHRLQSIQLFHELGLNVFIFDYRGYGRSGGRPGEDGTYHDARAAWSALLARGAMPAATVVLGRSLGGAVAAALAREVSPAALIVESTFTSVPDLAATLYPWLPVRALARIEYDTRSRLRERSCPLLIVHSTEDELIPYSHALALLAAANDPKALLTIRGPHAGGFLESGEVYRSGIATFLSKVT